MDPLQSLLLLSYWRVFAKQISDYLDHQLDWACIARVCTTISAPILPPGAGNGIYACNIWLYYTSKAAMQCNAITYHHTVRQARQCDRARHET
jgi:hypothetical protein